MSSEYRVNKSTGQVVKDDGTGWKPVASVRNKTTGEILIDEGNGWQPVPGAQRTLQADRGMTMASERANQAMASGQRIAPDDLTKLGQPDFSSAAMARLPAPTMNTQQLDAFDAEKRVKDEQMRVPDSNFKERSILALNTPTFGSGPRFAAGMQTLGALAATPFVEGDIIDREGISGATSQFLDEARIHQRRGREERMGESLAIEVIPGLFQGKTIIDTLGKRVLPATNTVSNVGRVAGVGGLYGAIYAGSQNESGTAEGVAQDAAFGGALGVGGGLLLKGAEPAATATYRTAKTAGASLYDGLAAALGKAGGARDKVAQDVAIAAVRRSADRSGLTIEQMLDLVKKYEGKPAVLAEIIGQDALNALTALTRRPGATSQKATDIAEARATMLPDRAKGDLEDASGIQIGNIDETLTKQLDERQAAAKPLYDALYKRFNTIESFRQPGQTGQVQKRLNRLARTPILQRHLELADKAMKTSAAVRGIPVSKMSVMERWDLVKRSLDDAIDSAVAKGEARTKVGESVGDLVRLKEELVGEMDRLTGGAYAAAREAGGEAPRLRAAATAGQKALGARNPKEVAKTVAATLAQDLPAMRAGMVDDIATRIDKPGFSPRRFRSPDLAGKVRAVFGEEAGNRFLEKMDAEADLAMKGSRWAPNVNSVTGTVMESGATAMGDDLINAGFNLASGNKLGLVRQAINFMRQRGFSQRQIDAIGDLLLSSPEEGLRRLKLMAPEGVPGNIAAPIAGAGGPDGLPPGGGGGITPQAAQAASATPAGPIRAAGLPPITSPLLKDAVAGGVAGSVAYKEDLNGDGVRDWKDALAGAGIGVGVRRLASPLFRGTANSLNPTYIPKSKPLPPEPPPMKAAERRYDDLRRLAEAEARKSGQTLTPEQLKQRVDDDYRAFYKKDPPGMEQSPEMLAQGWQRSLRDAVDTLEKEAGPGNYTAYDVEREAITSFTDYYGSVRLPKNTLADADKLVPGTVDPSDLTPPSDIKPQGPGALRGDLGNALAGAGLGAFAPADSNEERLRNMAIGAGIGGASRTVGRLAGAKGDDVARTAGVGGGPKPPKSTAQQGHAGRVSTRVPFAKGPVEDHLANEKLTISTQQFRDDPKLAAKAQAKIHTYSGFSVRQGEKPMETIERFQKQVTDNLLFLYDNIAENIVDRSRQWYVGARKVVDDWTTEYQGLTDTQAASVIAALSPQNEWNNNVSIAKRVIDIFMNRMDTRFSTDMEKVAATVAPKKIHKPILDRIRGKTLAEAYAMGDAEAGMWIRMFDEAYGDRGVRSLSPEGNFGDYMRTGKGEPTAKRWNSFAEVAKAISVLRDPSPARISDALGQGHKVRNFYNNMLDPNAPLGDVTIDTHAAAAAHLRPFSSKDEIAVEAMRGIGHAKTGSSGLYGLYADAYREAANQRGVLPREMQSVTWEAVKTLFTPSFKTATKRGKSDPIQAIWLAHEAGDISADEARRQIFAAAGGIDNPSWAKSGSDAGRAGPVRNAPVEAKLSGNGGPGSPQPAGAGRLGSGKRNAPSGVGQPARGLGEDLPPIKGAGFTGFDITAPGQQIAKGLRAIDRRARSPKDPRLTGPAIGPMPAKVTNAPAIEQVSNPVQAQGQLANALYAANSVTSGGPRGQLAATIKGKAQRYEADLSRRRQDAAGLSTEAKAARDAYNRAQTAYEKAWSRLITLRNSRASAAEIQPVADQVARLDTIRKQLQAKIPRQSRVPSASPVAAARRIAAGIRSTRGPMSPSRRQLENLNEVTDLLTNPARARDAQRVSQAKPLGSHERAGQAVFWGGVGGAGAYSYAENEKRKR